VKRLDRNQAILVVIDVQEKMMPVMDGRAGVERNLQRLIRGIDVLEMPVLVTEQYSRGLGVTAAPVRRALEETGGYSPIEKSCFSAAGCEAFMEQLKASHRAQVLIAGVEAHVCVYQTVTDLISRGFDVNIVADAVTSRSPVNREIALQRMVSEGAKLTSTEMCLFELLINSGTQEFRDISRLVK
jgi:nicotinamidase-related amidase